MNAPLMPPFDPGFVTPPSTAPAALRCDDDLTTLLRGLDALTTLDRDRVTALAHRLAAQYETHLGHPLAPLEATLAAAQALIRLPASAPVLAPEEPSSVTSHHRGLALGAGSLTAVLCGGLAWLSSYVWPMNGLAISSADLLMILPMTLIGGLGAGISLWLKEAAPPVKAP